MLSSTSGVAPVPEDSCPPPKPCRPWGPFPSAPPPPPPPTLQAQLTALRRLVQLLDPPLHAFLQARDSLNLFFCYRWVLIAFKREFGFEEVRSAGGWGREEVQQTESAVCPWPA